MPQVKPEHSYRQLFYITFSGGQRTSRCRKTQADFLPFHLGTVRSGASSSLHLLPQPGRLAALQRDYGHMGEMIFGEQPQMSMILDQLGKLEQQINE